MPHSAHMTAHDGGHEDHLTINFVIDAANRCDDHGAVGMRARPFGASTSAGRPTRGEG